MDVYGEILSALEIEEHVMLATVISASGSTPASALSKMIIKKGGSETAGSVGGGCMEGEVIRRSAILYGSGRAEIMTFSLDEEETESGLICGGSLDLLIEQVSRAQIPLFKELESLCSDGEDSVLASLLTGENKIAWKQLIPCGSCSAEPLTSLIPHLTANLEELIKKAHHRQETQFMTLPYGELILEPVSGYPSLIIFGGGHISRHISRSAAAAGFRVTVVDDREKFANPGRFPEAVQTFAVNFSDAFELLKVKQSAYIVIVTRGHQYDEIVLEKAVNTGAKYIGMIGSRRKISTIYNHLMERGITADELKPVRAPIGIDIGAVSAEEIAISIVAELIQTRRKKNPSHVTPDDSPVS